MFGKLLLGIDIGTSSTKGVLVDDQGEIVARSAHEHGTSRPRPGWFEHDAQLVWWDDFVYVTRELLGRVAGTVTGVAVSGIGPCLLAADDRGPLRPAILYGVDTRATAEIDELLASLGTDAILAMGGSPLTTQAIGPKLLWLRRHEPAVWEQTTRIFMASSFVVERLTGAYVLDHHSASQCNPLYDITATDWNHNWAELIAPGLPLPQLHWSDEVVGHVHAASAAATGLPVGVPVTAGTVDAWAEAESVGLSDAGDVMVMYGTTMFLLARVDQMSPSPSLWSTRGVRPDHLSLAAGMATAGSVTTWLRDLVGSDYNTLSAEAATVAAGSEGLLMLPYFSGERTPLFDARATGLLIGLTLDHKRQHLYRSVLEGVAFGVRHNLDAMRQAGGQIERLIAVGGGTAGDAWMQIVSDITALPQDVCAERIGASYGDAMLAAQATGVASATETKLWNPSVSRVEPRASDRDTYDSQYRRYLAAYVNNASMMHELSEVRARV